MLKRTLLTVSIGLSLVAVSFAQPAQTFKTGSSQTKSVYENYNTGPQRTTLTVENKFPDTGQVEVGGFYSYIERDMLERDTYGIYGRMGLTEFVTFQADVPFVDATYRDQSESGLGDIKLSLDLLAYQDLFQYPFVIPHVDVTLDTGDENKGLGSGDTVVSLGMSVGTRVYEVLTYVLDFSYDFNGAPENSEDKDTYKLSLSMIWDVTDRFAFIGEGRVYEQNRFDNTPYEAKGGFSYMFTPDVQLAVLGGVFSDETDMSDEDFSVVDVKVAVQF